jgi:hypothetical protein
MAANIPASVAALEQYCLTKLGAPVLDIAIDPQQLDDRIEDAMEFFTEFHGDGVERIYLKHQVTGNTLIVNNATVFNQVELLTGLTSGASVTVNHILTSTTLEVSTPTPIYNIDGDLSDATLVNGGFQIGETVVGSITGHTAVVSEWTTGDIDNGYITCDPSVRNVIGILPISASTSTNSVFDIRYQLRLSDLYSLQSASIIQYEQIQYHLALIDTLFVGTQNFRFNRQQSTIYIDMDWPNMVAPGQYIIIECYRALDPTVYTSIYNERALKQLATAYIKKQWGTNLKLFAGVALIGGITVNGQQIYDEAVQDCKEAEEHIISAYSLPPTFMVG